MYQMYRVHSSMNRRSAPPPFQHCSFSLFVLAALFQLSLMWSSVGAAACGGAVGDVCVLFTDAPAGTPQLGCITGQVCYNPCPKGTFTMCSNAYNTDGATFPGCPATTACVDICLGYYALAGHTCRSYGGPQNDDTPGCPVGQKCLPVSYPSVMNTARIGTRCIDSGIPGHKHADCSGADRVIMNGCPKETHLTIQTSLTLFVHSAMCGSVATSRTHACMCLPKTVALAVGLSFPFGDDMQKCTLSSVIGGLSCSFTDICPTSGQICRPDGANTSTTPGCPNMQTCQSNPCPSGRLCKDDNIPGTHNSGLCPPEWTCQPACPVGYFCQDLSTAGGWSPPPQNSAHGCPANHVCRAINKCPNYQNCNAFIGPYIDVLPTRPSPCDTGDVCGNCGANKVCLQSSNGDTSPFCPQGFSCMSNPCGPGLVCSVWNAATSTCTGGCASPCQTGFKCKITPLFNETTLGCPDGFTCQADVCGSAMACRATDFFGRTSTGCPNNQVCGEVCPDGYTCMADGGIYTAPGCFGGQICRSIVGQCTGTQKCISSLSGATGTSCMGTYGKCVNKCGGVMVCRQSLAATGTTVYATTTYALCPAGHTCQQDTCPIGLSCKSFASFSSTYCATNFRCQPVCALSEDCASTPGTQTPGCPSGFSCQTSTCPSGMRCAPFAEFPLSIYSGVMKASTQCGFGSICERTCTGTQICSFTSPGAIMTTGCRLIGEACETTSCATNKICISSKASCNSNPANPANCADPCPLGQGCVLSDYLDTTSLGCPKGRICKTLTPPCPLQMKCFNDNIAGTTASGCPSEHICAPVCPPGYVCGEESGNPATEPGCLSGHHCIPDRCGPYQTCADATTGCTLSSPCQARCPIPGQYCKKPAYNPTNIANLLCGHSDYTCDVCPEGEECIQNCGTTTQVCVSICPNRKFTSCQLAPAALLSNPNFVGFLKCPPKHICLPRCPTGYVCQDKDYDDVNMNSFESAACKGKQWCVPEDTTSDAACPGGANNNNVRYYCDERYIGSPAGGGYVGCAGACVHKCARDDELHETGSRYCVPSADGVSTSYGCPTGQICVGESNSPTMCSPNQRCTNTSGSSATPCGNGAPGWYCIDFCANANEACRPASPMVSTGTPAIDGLCNVGLVCSKVTGTTCPTDYVCKDDHIAGTTSGDCPTEQVCAHACPSPATCEASGASFGWCSSSGYSCHFCPQANYMCKYNASNSAGDGHCGGPFFECQPVCAVIGEYCLPSGDPNGFTQLGCPPGLKCKNPCMKGYMCVDDKIPGTHDDGCPEKMVCTLVCPREHQCLPSMPSMLYTTPGCPQGHTCQTVTATTSVTIFYTQTMSHRITASQSVLVTNSRTRVDTNSVTGNPTQSKTLRQSSTKTLPSSPSTSLVATKTLSVTPSAKRSKSVSAALTVTKQPKRTHTVSTTVKNSDSKTVARTPSPKPTDTHTMTSTVKNTASVPVAQTVSNPPKVTRTVSETKTLNKQTPTQTLPLPPATLPPAAAAAPKFPGSIVTAYTSRYIFYPPVLITGLVSGVPLPFSESYRQLFTQRFLIRTTSNQRLRFGLQRSPSTSRPSIVARLAPTRTVAFTPTAAGAASLPSAFNLQANGMAADASLFVRIDAPSVVTGSVSAPNFTCGDIMTAQSVLTFASNAAEYTSIQLAVATEAATPQCRSDVRYSGLIYSSVPFQRSVEKYYAAMVSTAIASSVIAPQGVYNSTAAVEHFRLTSGDWRGPSSVGFFPAGLALLNLVGDPTNVRRLPAPIASQHLHFVYPTNASLQDDAIRIGPDTASIVACTTGEQYSFQGTYIAPKVNVSFGLPSRCFEFDTVDDLHAACQIDSGCVGFNTIRMPYALSADGTTAADLVRHKELPHCLYRAGTTSSVSDTQVYQRMYYAKPSATELVNTLKCSVSVAQSGQIAVYVMQTTLSTNTVVVRVNGKVAAVCGQDKLFANGFGGRDGSCNLLALCHAGSVSAASTVEVSAPSGIQHGGCEHSMATLIQQTSVDATQVNATVETPIERYNTTDMVTRNVRRTAASLASSSSTSAGSATGTIRLFTYGATRAALDVFQSGFSCKLLTARALGQAVTATTPTHACPTHAVEFSAVPFSLAPTTPASAFGCQRCGGLRGFYQNGRAGRSDECDTGMFCGGFLSLFDSASPSSAACETTGAALTSATSSLQASSASTASLVLTLVANYSALAHDTEQCIGVHARVHAAAAPSASVPVFPLPLAAGSSSSSSSSATLFRPHIAVPRSGDAAAAADPQAYIRGRLGLPQGSTNTFARLMQSVGPGTGQQYDAYYVPWGTMAAVSAATMHVNTTQVCMIDHTLGLGGRCVFYVPLGSTRVRLLAAQNDYAGNNMLVSFELGALQPATAAVTCGGVTISADGAATTNRFGTRTGSQGRCAAFETCADQFIYKSDSDAANATSSTIVVDIPAAMTYQGCDFLGLFVAEFSKPPQASATCPEFECPGDRKCIRYRQLCDQVQDCSQNTDEAGCYDYTELPKEAFCMSPALTRSYAGVTTFDECRRLALQEASPAFTIANRTCVVYNATAAPGVYADPASFVCPSTGSTFVSLPGGLNSFRLCRSSIHCRGRGAVRSTTTAPPCACDCFLGYQGDSCDQRLSLETIAYVIVELSVSSLAASADLNKNVIATALKLSSTLITVACVEVIPFNATVVQVACEVDSVQRRPRDTFVHKRLLLNPSALSTINAELTRQFHPPAIRVTSRGTMNPVVPLSACNATTSGSSSSSSVACPVPRAVDSLRIIAQRNVSVLSMRVVVEEPPLVVGSSLSRAFFDASSSSSPSVRRSEEVTCTPAITASTGGCLASTCAVSIAAAAGAVVRVSDIVYANESLITSACAAEGISTNAQVSFGNIVTDTNTTVSNRVTDYTGFLISGISLFLAGTFLFSILTLICCCRWKRELRQVHAAIDQRGLSRIERAKMGMMARLFLFRQIEHEGRYRSDRLGILYFVIALLFGFAASFLTIYYQTAYDLRSNFSVLYEEYSDSDCSNSRSAYMPRRLFAVAPGSYTCEKMQATGESTGALYATGHCTGEVGAYEVSFKQAGSFARCQAAKSISVRSGRCVPIRQIIPDATRNTFVSLTCSDASRVTARSTTLDILTRIPDEFVQVPVTSVVDELRYENGNSPDATRGNTYVRTALAGSSPRVITSFEADTVDTQARAEDFNGDDSAMRLVLQQAACTFDDDALSSFSDSSSSDASSSSATYCAAIAARESGLKANLSGLPPLPFDSPRTSDTPIGFIFNGFGTTAPTTWNGAGAGAHRYYDIKGSIFDIGANFPASGGLSQLVEGEGYSISLYLRADKSTLGFAFAVTDAFENPATNVVYTLERLAKIIDNGQSGAAWFNETYKVYQSLYVNGPGGTLTFAYADGTVQDPAARMTLLEFDLATIGMQRVTNGLWHHIAIVFVVENGKVRAQLLVDGETSYAKKGWSVCVNNLPGAITPLLLNETAPVYSATTDNVRPGGVLVTGYFNGGVYALTAQGSEVLNTAYLQRGSQAMRDHSAFPRTYTLALGIVLLLLGVFAIVLVAVTGKRDVSTMLRNAGASRNIATAHLFYAAMKGAMFSMRRQGLEERRRQAAAAAAVDSSGAEIDLLPIRFTTALRWTGLSVEDIGTVAQEIGVQARDPAVHLLLFILQMHTHQPQKKSMTVAEWNLAVREDAAAQAECRKQYELRLQNALFPSLLRLCLKAPPHTDDVVERKLLYAAQEKESEQVRKQSSSHAVAATPAAASSYQAESIAAGSAQPQQQQQQPDFSDLFTNHFTEDGRVRQRSWKNSRKQATPPQDIDDNEGKPQQPSDASSTFRRLSRRATVTKGGPALRRRRRSTTATSTSRHATSATGDDNNEGKESRRRTTTRHSGGGGSTGAGQQEEPPSVDAGDLLMALGGTAAVVGSNAGGLELVDIEHAASAEFDGDGQQYSDAEGGGDSEMESFHNDDEDEEEEIEHDGIADEGMAAAGELNGHSDAIAGAAGLGGGGGSLSKTISETIAPMVAVFQSMYVWSTSIELPNLYDDYFRGLFSFISVDFSNTFADLPTLITPLVQLFVGLAAVAFVVYYMAEDNNRFEKALIRYIWRRDELEGTPQIQQSQAEHFPLALVEALDDPLVPHPIIPMHVLPVTQARRLDVFRGKISDPREQFPDGRCDVETYDGQKLAVVLGPSKNDLLLESTTTTTTTESLSQEIQQQQQNQLSAPDTRSSVFGEDDGGDTAEAAVVRGTTAASSPDASVQPPPPPQPSLLPPTAIQPTAAVQKRPVERTSVCCRRHTSTRLTAQMQTDIWPFSNPPTCCMVVGGKLCGEQCGVVYSCGDTMIEEVEDDCSSSDDDEKQKERTADDPNEQEEDEEKKKKTSSDKKNKKKKKRTRTVLCTYALCDQHCRLSLFELLVSRAYAFKRAVWDNGLSWLLCIGIVFAANAAYTPFIKTALMILGCHPFYQCEFKNCWGTMDQKYALAVYLSIIVVLFFGVGFPVSLVMLLWSRKRAMDTLFLDPDYNGKYAEGKQNNHQESHLEAEEQNGNEWKKHTGKETSGRSSPEDGQQEGMEAAWPVSKSAPPQQQQQQQLRHGEWARFVSTDTTALAQQYQPVFYRWMFFPGLLIVFKVLTLIPAIFAEPRSFEQRLGVALVEVGIAVFMFATTTQLSPVLLVTIRVASIHQLLVLSIQNLNLVTQNDSNLTIAPVMIGITMLYFIFTAAVIVATVVAPTLAERYNQRRLRALLNAHGLDYARSISTYIDPTRHVSAANDAEAHRLDPLVGIRRSAAIRRATTMLRRQSTYAPHHRQGSAAESTDQPFSSPTAADDDGPAHRPRLSLLQRRRRSSVQRPSSALFAGFVSGIDPTTTAAAAAFDGQGTPCGSDPVHNFSRRSTVCVSSEGIGGNSGFHSVASPNMNNTFHPRDYYADTAVAAAAATSSTSGGMRLRRRLSMQSATDGSSAPSPSAAALGGGGGDRFLAHTAVLQLSQQEGGAGGSTATATTTALTPKEPHSPLLLGTQMDRDMSRMANIDAMFGGTGASSPLPPGALASSPLQAAAAAKKRNSHNNNNNNNTAPSAARSEQPDSSRLKGLLLATTVRNRLAGATLLASNARGGQQQQHQNADEQEAEAGIFFLEDERKSSKKTKQQQTQRGDDDDENDSRSNSSSSFTSRSSGRDFSTGSGGGRHHHRHDEEDDF